MENLPTLPALNEEGVRNVLPVLCDLSLEGLVHPSSYAGGYNARSSNAVILAYIPYMILAPHIRAPIYDLLVTTHQNPLQFARLCSLLRAYMYRCADKQHF